MKWITEDETRATMLLESGLCYDEIGKILNRSPKSVKEKLGKLGFKREDYIKDSEIKIFCLECGIAFETKDHERKFCGQSCAASYNNKKFVKRKSNKERQYKCLNCGERNNTYYNTYCSQTCHHEYKNKKKIVTGEMGHTGMKKFLIKERGEKCEECGWDKKNPITNKVPIQMDHIDGNYKNNSIDNLKLLCPNCHSLTPTFMALNKGNGRKNR